MHLNLTYRKDPKTTYALTMYVETMKQFRATCDRLQIRPADVIRHYVNEFLKEYNPPNTVTAVDIDSVLANLPLEEIR